MLIPRIIRLIAIRMLRESRMDLLLDFPVNTYSIYSALTVFGDRTRRLYEHIEGIFFDCLVQEQLIDDLGDIKPDRKPSASVRAIFFGCYPESEKRNITG